MLFFLKIFLYCPLDPDDTSEKDESHRREDHKTVVHITGPVERFRDDPESEESAASEEFTEKCDDDKDETEAACCRGRKPRYVPLRYSW